MDGATLTHPLAQDGQLLRRPPPLWLLLLLLRPLLLLPLCLKMSLCSLVGSPPTEPPDWGLPECTGPTRRKGVALWP